eukprot:COSAG01_NODE_53107_length_341_cov_1.247934_1_plen_56_part_10
MCGGVDDAQPLLVSQGPLLAQRGRSTLRSFVCCVRSGLAMRVMIAKQVELHPTPLG